MKKYPSLTLVQRKQLQLALGVFNDGIIGDNTLGAAYEKLVGPLVQPVVNDVPPLTGLQHNDWPLEENAQAFFGYPANLVTVESPFTLDVDGGHTQFVTCNVKVAASLRRIFAAINALYKGDIEAMRRDGVNYYDGIFNDRNVRGANHRSMHAYGAAIDIDAAHNQLGATVGKMPKAVVDIFKAEGWRWGGDYTGRKDWMHFEACR